MKKAIEFKQVGFGYDKDTVLSDVSFSVNQGDFVAIVGNNGAGKTTLLKMTNGLLKPNTGEVFVRGVSTARQKTSEIAQKVGMLFQRPEKQICQNTVFDEIAFGLRIRKEPEDAIARKVESLLTKLSLEKEAAPYTLSRGEQQLLAFASVIVLEPEILVLDEPTTGLDYRECMIIMEQVKMLNRQGATVVMICHDMEVVLDFAQRVLVMAQGALVAGGSPETIFRNEEVMKRSGLLPPQLIDLSLRLEKAHEDGRAFSYVASSYEMVQVLCALGFRKRKVAV